MSSQQLLCSHVLPEPLLVSNIWKLHLPTPLQGGVSEVLLPNIPVSWMALALLNLSQDICKPRRGTTKASNSCLCSLLLLFFGLKSFVKYSL